MRLARLGAVGATVFSIAILAACGGGGGGSIPNPGGGNGPGATATPTPVATGTATPTPGVTPTPVQTATPVQTPTPVPTPVQTPTPVATPTAVPTSSQQTVNVGDGEVNGTDDQIKTSAPNTHNNPGEGDLMAGDPGATAAGGGQGATIDNIPCIASMPDNYHVHAFVGIIYNGQEIALPDGLGIADPGGDMTFNNAPNQEVYGTCFYYTHTHDPSGEVHIEAPAPTCGIASNYATPCNTSLYTLGNLLDVWGISLTAGNFGPFSGPVSIYTTPPSYVACGSPCYTHSNTYSLYTGDPTQIPIYSHTTIWIVVGTQPDHPWSLPNIQWINGVP